jgi:hypothetical protein
MQKYKETIGVEKSKIVNTKIYKINKKCKIPKPCAKN